ncbi:MAG TPA: hypothetical protein VMC09_18930 [Anaerolineales bacterium]|nr:hypothetical protein [Anaerolineales bacterium]
MKTLLRDLIWILPAGLGTGLLLSLLGGGTWWIGWLAYSLLLVLGMLALSALWRSAGTSRTLGLMLLLALVLRLGLGIAFSYILPAYGNDTDVQNAGYIFSDAYHRDTQAWTLASSGDSLLKAFDKSFSVDQYGGLLFAGSLLDRFLSPDAHRPWLMVVLSALAGTIAVAFAYKAAQKVWGGSLSVVTGWIMALYPEAVLLGSSQMREPFLMAFVAMMFWGLATWAENRRTSIAWMTGSLVGLLLFHPGIAVAAVAVLAGWIWLSRKERRIPWWAWAGTLAILVLAAGLFAWALRGSAPGKGGPISTLVNWIRYTTQYDSYVLEQNSGWVQTIFSHVPKVFHLPFIIGYGILQPVLPAAIGDVKAVWPMQTVGILRGLGWFAMLPFLIYCPFALWKMTDKRERLAWFWLWIAMAVWMIISSARGGGDQWDNPRYRAILLVFQAVLAAQVLNLQRITHSRGLGRLLAVEAVFVACFSAWTISRYDASPAVLPLGGMAGAFVVVSALILLGDWLWVRYRGKKQPAD